MAGEAQAEGAVRREVQEEAVQGEGDEESEDSSSRLLLR